MTGRQLKLNDFFNARHVAMAMPSTSTAVDDPLPQPSPEAEAMEEPQPQVPPSPVGRPRVAIVMVMPTNTACCERAFSALNRIKNRLRSSLEHGSLEDCLTASILLPNNLDEYNVDGAINLWYTPKRHKQHKKPSGSTKKKKVAITIETVSTSSAEASDGGSENSNE